MSTTAHNKNALRIIIAGGGTGGHIFPAIAIANAIKEKDAHVEILFIGATGKMEMEKVPQAGYAIEGLPIAGLNRQSILKNIGLPFKLVRSFLRVRSIFASFKPDAVIGVGGYSSFPVLRYAQSVNVPTFIHESNAFAGKANIFLGRKATRVFVASEGMEKFFPREKIMLTGNPVRKNITASKITREEALAFFGLKAGVQTVLAIGGSLGARSINEAIAAHIDDFATNDLQLVWQTGKTTAADYLSKAEGKNNIWIGEFISQMEMAYAAADIIISRAGAMSVTEICVAAKPVVFVPFPHAAEDHQTSNAMYLVKRNAALIVTDSDAKEKLVQTVVELSRNGSMQANLSDNIKTLAIINADEMIAKEILHTVK